MNMSDPIADMLTRMRNGLMARHQSWIFRTPHMKERIASILQDEGFIRAIEVVRDGAKIHAMRVDLKYTPERRPVMTHLQRCQQAWPAPLSGRPRSRACSAAWAS